MNREITVGTGKGVSIPVTREATPRTRFRRVSGINLSNDAFALNFVADHIEDHTTRPSCKPSVPSFRTSFALTKLKIFENQNAVIRSPLNKLFRRAMTKIFGSARSLKLQPFEGSDDAPSIFTLCLSLLKLSLESLDHFRCAFVEYFAAKSGNEKLVSVYINRHDRIGLVQIDPNRMNSFDVRKFDRVGNVAHKLITKTLDDDAIDFNRVAKNILERFRYNVLEMLPAFDRRNAEKTVFREACIATSSSDEEKSKRLSPSERATDAVTVFLGSRVCPRGEPDACACKLTRDSSLNILVNAVMQIESFQRFAIVPRSLRYTIAYLSEAIERSGEILIKLDNNLQGSLSKHHIGDTTTSLNSYLFSGGDTAQFISGIKTGVPLR